MIVGRNRIPQRIIFMPFFNNVDYLGHFIFSKVKYKVDACVCVCGR